MATPIPVYPDYGIFAPYVDRGGYVKPYIDLGKIPLGESLELPLVLNFSSEVRPPSQEFGQGWECPAFDSRLIDYQKNCKELKTLGGKVHYLVWDKKQEVWKHAYSEKWRGKESGGSFDLTHESGIRFQYRKGLISSMTMPDGRKFEWRRFNGKLASIGQAGKSPALEIQYDDNGFARKILLQPDRLGNARKSYTLAASLVYAGIEKIEGSDGRKISFERSRDRAGRQVAELRDSRHLPLRLSWDTATGHILGDGKWDYVISPVNRKKKTGPYYPQMARTNRANGKTESYLFDPRTGIEKRGLQDGTIRLTHWIVAPGAPYKQIRLIEEQSKDGPKRTVLRRAFDSQGRLILEATGLANGKERIRQFVYDEAGRLASCLIDGQTDWKNLYDQKTGELAGRELPRTGARVLFEKLPAGQVKQTLIQSGGQKTTTTLTPEAWARMLQSAAPSHL